MVKRIRTIANDAEQSVTHRVERPREGEGVAAAENLVKHCRAVGAPGQIEDDLAAKYFS